MSVLESLKEISECENIKKSMPKRQIDIILAAIELFSQKGYEATSTSEIAKKANVSEGTIYRYYKNKKELLLAIPECFAQEPFATVFTDDFNKIFDNEYEKFEDFLRAFIFNRQKFAKDNLPIIKVIFQEIAFHPELRDKIPKTAFLPCIEKVNNIIKMFQKKGEIIYIPRTDFIKLISTSIIGFFFARYIAMIDNSDEEEGIEYLIIYIMNGISIKK